MVKKVLIFCYIGLVYINPSVADIVSGNCNELSQEILAKYAEFEDSIVSNNGKLTASQAIEVDKLVSLACSVDFEKCGYNICKDSSIQSPSPTPSPTIFPNELPIPVSTESTNVPLSWITENMSCEAFLSQLRGRFHSDDMDDAKRKELKMALDLACGAKFKHCGFEACRSVSH